MSGLTYSLLFIIFKLFQKVSRANEVATIIVAAIFSIIISYLLSLFSFSTTETGLILFSFIGLSFSFLKKERISPSWLFFPLVIFLNDSSSISFLILICSLFCCENNRLVSNLLALSFVTTLINSLLDFELIYWLSPLIFLATFYICVRQTSFKRGSYYRDFSILVLFALLKYMMMGGLTASEATFGGALVLLTLIATRGGRDKLTIIVSGLVLMGIVTNFYSILILMTGFVFLELFRFTEEAEIFKRLTNVKISGLNLRVFNLLFLGFVSLSFLQFELTKVAIFVLFYSIIIFKHLQFISRDKEILVLDICQLAIIVFLTGVLCL